MILSANTGWQKEISKEMYQGGQYLALIMEEAIDIYCIKNTQAIYNPEAFRDQSQLQRHLEKLKNKVYFQVEYGNKAN